MKHKYIFLLACIMYSVQLVAQPANDECADATVLTDVSNWCSTVAQFTTVNATPSADPSPTCFPTAQTNNDIWFSFVAQAENINISVAGNTNLNPGGTLQSPQLALYSGNCGNLVEEECISDAFNNNVAETFGGPLIIGQTYYIRVGARNGNTGTFQLCINNFNQVPDPKGDCSSGVVLCDKSPFTVQNVTGVGNDPFEINNNNSCAISSLSCNIGESASSWYKWTCKDAGSLTFTLTPLNPADDIDFVLFELPNGVENCSGKQALRCMFSGENVGQPLSNWQVCTGATGLNLSDADVSEICGCQAGNNNFASGINMQVGKSYALYISNFSNSGSGFSISFGGTGTFLGPEAKMQISPAQSVCYGNPMTFSDISSFPGGTITSHSWNFGPGATPPTASGSGPHQVTWSTPGQRSVVLIVQTEEGCLVTEIQTVTIDSCCNSENAITANGVVTNLLCADIFDGAIDVTSSSAVEPHTFMWSNSANSEDIDNLMAGDYSITITNQAGCEEVLDFTVTSPPPIVPNINIIMPTCDGGMDGVLTVLGSGGVGPYTYDLNDGNGFTTNNTLTNIPIGFYPVTIQDANGCLKDTTIEVKELELELDGQGIAQPSCFGFSNGSITMNIINGLPPYQYNYNDGNGWVTNNVLDNIPAGTYIIDVVDANNCEGHFEIVVGEPSMLALDMDTIDVSCFGAGDGMAIAHVTGGVGGYTYMWSNGGTDSVIINLVPGDYMVTILDANNCEIQGAVTIIEPPELFINVVEIIDVLCFGDSTGQITVAATGGVPDYLYSADGQNYQMSPVLENLLGGDHILYVQDANGCIDTVAATILQPPQLFIDAGPDQTIDLGFSTTLPTLLSPPLWPVSYQWFPADSLSCADCPRPTATPTETTTYTVVVTDSNGCTAMDEVTVFVVKNRPIYIPNVFSPDNNGHNDFFTIFGGPAARQINILRIYNRWGGMVFETKNIPLNEPLFGWNGTFKGKPLNPDVFVYYTEIEFVDNEVILYKGGVTIVR